MSVKGTTLKVCLDFKLIYDRNEGVTVLSLVLLIDGARRGRRNGMITPVYEGRPKTVRNAGAFHVVTHGRIRKLSAPKELMLVSSFLAVEFIDSQGERSRILSHQKS